MAARTTAASGHAGELADAFTATVNGVRDRLVADIAEGRFRPEPGEGEGEDPLGPMVVTLDQRLSRERAVDFRSRLAALVAEFDEAGADAQGVPVEFLLMFWSPR